MYPKSRLTRPIRRTIMIILIVSFFIVSPLIILYTAGYRYDFDTHKIKQTGVISIDIEPDDAQVYLNSILLNKNIPIRLPNRAPGTYSLKLKRDGYHDWQKDITVESRKTVYVKDITLFRQALPVQILGKFKGRILSIHSSPYTQTLLVLSEQDDIYEINLYNTEDSTLEPLVRTRALNAPKIDWSPYDNYFVIQTTEATKQTLQIFNVNNLEQSKTLTFSTKENISFHWPKKAFFPTIYLKQNSNIKLVSTVEERKIGSADADVWYVDEKENIWFFDEEDYQLINSAEDKEYSTKEKINKIIEINGKRIILQGEHNIYSWQKDGDKITYKHAMPTGSAAYHRQTREWITWSPWELWTVYEDGRVALLNRTGEKNIFVSPLDEHGVLLLASKNKITGFNPGYYVSHELFANGSIKAITADMENRKIYFWGSVGQREGLFELDY